MKIYVNDLDQGNDIIEVFSNEGGTEFLQGKRIYLPKELKNLISGLLWTSGSKLQRFFDTGIRGRLMTTASPKWQVGRLILTIEFISDEDPSTPPDDLDKLKNK